ncbi:MAG TPA: GNAT family N-acetyltransferase [Mesorhizobium sp.]
MPATIEPMREEDVEAVARLRVESFFKDSGRTHAEDVADLRDMLRGDGFECSMVARIGAEPVGSVLFVRHELEPAHALTPWLAGLAVAKAFRGRGIGAALVRAVEAHARAVGAEPLYLYTWQARDFYAALGWQAVESLVQDGEPMFLMMRRLAPAAQDLPAFRIWS